KYLIALRPGIGAFGLILPVLIMGEHAARLSLDRALLLLLVLAATPLPVAAGSLWLSARCRRTAMAASAAYFATAVALWGTLAAFPPLYAGREALWWYASPAWQAAVLCLAE